MSIPVYLYRIHLLNKPISLILWVILIVSLSSFKTVSAVAQPALPGNSSLQVQNDIEDKELLLTKKEKDAFDKVLPKATSKTHFVPGAYLKFYFVFDSLRLIFTQT